MNIQLNKQYCTLVAIEAQLGHLRDFNIGIIKKKRDFPKRNQSSQKRNSIFAKETLFKQSNSHKKTKNTILIIKRFTSKNSNYNSKNEHGVSRRTGDPQQIQRKDVIDFIKNNDKLIRQGGQFKYGSILPKKRSQQKSNKG